jgi:cycloartenol synthase
MIILFQGYNGSQLWDTSFAVQAIISTKLVEEYGPTLRKAHAYIKNSQVCVCVFFFFYIYNSLKFNVREFVIMLSLNYSNFKVVDPFIFAEKVLEDCPGDLSFWYRHISKGAWPFSTADHGWPISDCTAEGLKVMA